jgi:hypothetical protein
MKGKVKIMEILEKKKYYKPIYCYRRFPMNSDIYEHIIEDLLKHKKITLYEDIKKAEEAGIAQLIDDDCYEIAIFDFTQGFCKIYYNREHYAPHNTIAYLDCRSKCYEIIQTEVES